MLQFDLGGAEVHAFALSCLITAEVRTGVLFSHGGNFTDFIRRISLLVDQNMQLGPCRGVALASLILRMLARLFLLLPSRQGCFTLAHAPEAVVTLSAS